MATQVYTPEMGQSKPVADIEADLSYYGKHYFLRTALELETNRGVKFYQVGDDGRNVYKVTIKAYDKLEAQYSISREAHLD